MTGRVYVIGAGPGDPGLLSARGVRLLSEADVVVYDAPVAAVLRWARPEAERIAVGAPAEKAVAQEAIAILLAEKAREGHVVARLKWGDPFVFASGAREALFLHEQQIPFEVVPGIPAAVGAAAYAGIPLTYPGAGDTIVLLRGNEGDADAIPDVDWRALAAIDGTLVCYAGGRQVPRVLGALIDAGASGDRAAALVLSGTLPDQETRTGTVAELFRATSDETPPGPGLLIVGDVAGLRSHLRWYDARPLFGRRIVITRSPEQAASLIEPLEALGAQAIEAPTFRLLPAEDPEAIDRAAASIDQYDWAVFEGASAATRFLSALARGPRDLRALGRVSVGAIGPSTADRLFASGIKPDVVVPEHRSDRIGEALVGSRSLEGQRVLIVRPDHLHDLLAQDLAARGAAVTDLVAYRSTPAPPDAPAAQQLYRLLLDGKVDAVTFASPTAVNRFAAIIGEEQAADLLGTTVVATIGPVTAAAARERGITPTIVADPYTTQGLVAGLVEYFTRQAEAGSVA
ncbi:MAG: uroporphyrinogen-III C-methyltransferase [Vicinamibacterales bacterium]